MTTSGEHGKCDREFLSANSMMGNLPELIAFWRSLREEHYLIISLPDERYVQLLVTSEGEVVCEVIADRFMEPELHWNMRQRAQLKEHFAEPTGEPKTSPNWHYFSGDPEATLEAPMKAAFALYKVLRVRPETKVLVDLH
jgi:hypothetical protein